MPRAPRAELFGDLMAELQRSYVRGLLRRGGERLAGRAPALCAWLEQESLRRDAFRVPLASQAALVDSALQGRNDTPWLAAMTGLALHAQGARVEWSIQLDEPARVRRGAFISPLCTRLEVRGTRLCVDGKWVEPADRAELRAAGFMELPSLAWGTHEVVLLPERFSALCPLPVADRAADAEAAALVPVLAETLSLLERCSPAFVSWVLDALATLAPLCRHGKDHRSGSYNHVVGCIGVGVPLEVAPLAELLVHEASHQYLLALRAAYSITNGRDQAEYFSPFPRKMRPIEGILVGYHAFANVEHMQLDLLRCERDDVAHAAHAWLATWQPELRRCEEMLAASPGLTAIGRSLWEPVADSLKPHTHLQVPAAREASV